MDSRCSLQSIRYFLFKVYTAKITILAYAQINHVCTMQHVIKVRTAEVNDRKYVQISP